MTFPPAGFLYAPKQRIPTDEITFAGGVSADPSEAHQSSRLIDALNVVPHQGVGRPRVVTRPGFEYNAGPGAASGDSLAVGGEPVPWVIQGGVLYSFAPATSTWSTLQDLTVAPYSLNVGVGLWDTAAFAGGVVVSDGTNKPVYWDGSTTSPVLTVMTNCPVLYGRPAVYYGKLFGIKNTERDTIVWSEENDPFTGYEAGGYNNAWTLDQTGTLSLQGLIGTNEGLHYFRQSAIGTIRGPVTTAFQASGVVDDVSVTTGTDAFRTITYADGWVFFLDSYRRAWRFRAGDSLGTTLQSLWPDQDRIEQSLTSRLLWKGVVIPRWGVVAFSVDPNFLGALQELRLFELQSGAYMGRWSGLVFRNMASLNDQTWPGALMVQGGTSQYYFLTDDLYGNRKFVDGSSVGDTAFEAAIETRFVFADSRATKHFGRMDSVFVCGTGSDQLTPTVEVESSEGSTASVTLPQFVAADATRKTRRVPVGLDVHGRWCSVRISDTVSFEWGLESLSLEATVEDLESNTP